MKLEHDEHGWHWIADDGYCTSQNFSSEAEARKAAAAEEAEMKKLNLHGDASVGILKWVY